ncbi:alcohol dehydrogenase class-3-like [Macrobrachium rosenbergii]|uniref:alcohol dehydrogenase class-3-like n=1 Tax=Macrobrachium rosenbergii TaxID=79674 RepID=UPI0034D67B21
MSPTKGKVIKCRAAVAWEQSKSIIIEEVEVAPPEGKEVRIKIVSAGLCHTDMSGWKGGFPNLFPSVLGHEGSGIVESVGEAVTSLKEGDHVLVFCLPSCRQCPSCQSSETNLCQQFIDTFYSDNKEVSTRLSCKGKPVYTLLGSGTYSEYSVIEESMLCKVNKEAPLDKIVPLSCGVTTGYGTVVNFAKVKPGSTCAVFGLGTVGLAAVMGCKLQGAKRIIGIDVNNGKKDIAKKLGVTEFYNPKEHNKPIEEVLVEKTLRGCDYVFECSGVREVLESAVASCRLGGGHCLLIGVPTFGEKITVDPYKILYGCHVSGCILGGYNAGDLSQLVDDYMKKKIVLDEFITSRGSINDINEAFENMGKGNSIKHVMFF